jgi:hypothetical protein
VRGACVSYVELCANTAGVFGNGGAEEALIERNLCQLVLKTSLGDPLARCRLAGYTLTPPLPEAEFHVLRGNGNYFATIASRGGTGSIASAYSLETVGGKQYKISGRLSRNTLQVQSIKGHLLAKATLCRADFGDGGEYYLVRAAPFVDLGLMICSLLALDYLGEGIS